MIRYTVTVKENGDKHHGFNLKQVNKWTDKYKDHCLNQDKPWCPHFEIKKETIE